MDSAGTEAATVPYAGCSFFTPPPSVTCHSCSCWHRIPGHYQGYHQHIMQLLTCYRSCSMVVRTIEADLSCTLFTYMQIRTTDRFLVHHGPPLPFNLAYSYTMYSMQLLNRLPRLLYTHSHVQTHADQHRRNNLPRLPEDHAPGKPRLCACRPPAPPQGGGAH